MASIPGLRCLTLAVLWLATLANVFGETATTKAWIGLETKRQMLPGLHQEFEVTRHFKSAYSDELSRRQIVVDVSPNQWREQSIGESGDLIRIFDGENVFLTEPEGTEFVRFKHKGGKDQPLPEPYGAAKLDWGKAKEIARVPCGFPGKDHTCVVVEAPVKAWFREARVGQAMEMSNGTGRVMMDSETGIWVQCHTMQLVEGSRGSYELDITYSLKRMSYGAAPDANLFKLPESGLREVKELRRWDEARIRRQLVGKAAPELQVKDIQGKLISLSDLKGKTVLLDFWTTWCPPCQSDAPAIEKLNQKYGGKDLGIIAISVDEERETVEKFLSKHPHSFPVVLSSENMLPRPYQIGTFPTYIVIGPDGTLISAEQGDQGFFRLRKTLEKAGMPTD